jgi:hypothetical protein
VRDHSRIDNDCGAVRGCFHGFVASRSKTDTFKALDSGTFCIRVEKELVQAGVENTPGVGWRILVTDSTGITNSFFTDQQGTTGSQICELAAGSYTVEEEIVRGYTQVGVFLNGMPVSSTSVLVTLGSGSVSGDQTVVFVNRRLTGS